MIPLSRHSVDHSPMVFRSSTHMVEPVSCFEVLSALLNQDSCLWMEACAWQSRHSVDHSPMVFRSSTHMVEPVSCFEVLSALLNQDSCLWMEACAWQGVGHGVDVWGQPLGRQRFLLVTFPCMWGGSII